MSRTTLQLYEPTSERRVNVETRTVFGRGTEVYAYADDPERAFGPEILSALTRLDFVEIRGDDKVSRTHGVLDPQGLLSDGRRGPTIRDLNSRNGVFLNGTKLPPTNTRGEGHAYPLADGDVLRIGVLEFRVEASETPEATFLGELHRARGALLLSADGPLIPGFLEERKRFEVETVSSFDTFVERLNDRLEDTSETGIFVVALRAEVEGTVVRLAGEERPALWFVHHINRLRGSKILAIESRGDPAGFERIFEREAHRDAILITSTVPDRRETFAPPIEDWVGSAPLEQIVRGKTAAAAYHGISDGLDALIPADSNVLDLSWYHDYTGALTLTCGTSSPPGDSYEEIGTAYLATNVLGSSRRRYCFDTSPLPPVPPQGGVDPSYPL